MKVPIVLLAFATCIQANPIDTNGLVVLETNPATLIVGGQLTTIAAFPWIVSLQRYGSHRCGASIISPSRILTAAHCTSGVLAYTLQIQANSTFIRNSGGQIIRVSSITNHFAFNARTLNNDISVLRLASSLVLGPGVQAIPLPAQSESVLSGANAEVAGWGLERESGTISTQLRYVVVPIVDPRVCISRYGSSITDGMVCAGLDLGGRDACQGDSGGPLTLGGKLVGIVSFGAGCARPFLPGVYARVSYFRNWIDTVV